MQIPGRTVAVVNVDSNIQKCDVRQLYNVRANTLLENEYPQLQTIPTLHKVDDTNHTLIPFVMVNLGEDHVFLPKSQVVGFLDPECIDVSEIELDITTIAINAIETPPTIKEKKLNKPQHDIPSDFITSPADVVGPRKASLQDFKVTEEETKAFKDLCENILTCFMKTLVVLVELHWLRWILTLEKSSCLSKTLHATLKTCRMGKERVKYLRSCRHYSAKSFTLG